MKTDLPMNISISVLTELAAKAHLTEGQLRSLKSTKNKIKSLRFQFSMQRPTVSKRVGQNLECCGGDDDDDDDDDDGGDDDDDDNYNNNNLFFFINVLNP